MCFVSHDAVGKPKRIHCFKDKLLAKTLKSDTRTISQSYPSFSSPKAIVYVYFMGLTDLNILNCGCERGFEEELRFKTHTSDLHGIFVV